MSQVTDIGVGSFSGGGNLDISIPGLQENAIVPCSWGPGIGFYLSVIAAVCLIVVPLLKIIKKKIGYINLLSLA